MSKTIDQLYEEHRDVVSKLQRLDTLLAGALGADNAAELESIVRFLETDLEVHLQVEEQALFPVLERYIGREGGPIAVMLMDHEDLRKRVRELRAAFEAWRQQPEPTPAVISELAYTAGQLSSLLYEHIMKEDNVLFVMARQHFNESDAQEVDGLTAAVARR